MKQSGSRRTLLPPSPLRMKYGTSEVPLGPFLLPPSQTVQARFRAYRFPEKTPHSKEKKEGLMHFAAGQLRALLKCSSCCPWPCMPLSGTPWEVVTPPTHYGSSVTLPLARFR